MWKTSRDALILRILWFFKKKTTNGNFEEFQNDSQTHVGRQAGNAPVNGLATVGSYPSNCTREGLSNKCALNGTPLIWTNSPLANAQHSYIPATIPPKKERSQKKTHWNGEKWMCWYVCFIAKSNQNPPKKETYFPSQKSSPCSRWPFFPPLFRPPTMTWPVGWVNPRLTQQQKTGRISDVFSPTTKWG